MVVKSSRYHWVVRYAHWLTVLAIVLAYVLVDLVDDEGTEGNSPPSLMLQGHYLAGLAVLALLLPRILARLTTPVPPIVPAAKTVIAFAAHGLHNAAATGKVVVDVAG